jgi:ribonuclease Z
MEGFLMERPHYVLMEILILGTSSMVPTADRNHPGILVCSGCEKILVDCGEGIQRQLKIANAPITKITRILISHWHGDHVLGLPGLLQTLNNLLDGKEVFIYGPRGIKTQINNMLRAFPFDNNLKLIITEIGQGKFIDNKDIIIESQPLKHGINTLGFLFTEQTKRKIKIPFIKKNKIPFGPLLGKLQSGNDVVWKGKKIRSKDATNTVLGKKMAIVSDTAPCKGASSLAGNVDLLICESTYTEDSVSDKGEHLHLTSKQAAEIALRGKAKKLVLTHFSARYKDSSPLLKEARKVYSKVICAEDFLRINV